MKRRTPKRGSKQWAIEEFLRHPFTCGQASTAWTKAQKQLDEIFECKEGNRSVWTNKIVLS